MLFLECIPSMVSTTLFKLFLSTYKLLLSYMSWHKIKTTIKKSSYSSKSFTPVFSVINFLAIVIKALSNPSLVHIFGDTTLEFPSTYEYVDRFRRNNPKTIVKTSKNREQNLARIQAKQEKLHQEALAKAAEIEKLGQIELSAKAGESGKLFGTITTKKLCEELKEKANIEVDRKTVSLNAPINKVGEFTMLIKLTSKVKTELKVVVTASEVVKESIEEEVVEETVEA